MSITTALIVGHPNLRKSRVNAALLAAVEGLPGIDIRVLADLYPDVPIDVAREQLALEAANHVALQYPTYWYSTPAILKRWLDEVLVSGWAYGPGAPGVLAGKTLRVVTTTGGVADAYHSDGFHGWEFDTVLAPLKATARRLGMAWLEPMIIHGVRDLTDHALADLQIEYRSLLALDDARPLRTAS